MGQVARGFWLSAGGFIKISLLGILCLFESALLLLLLLLLLLNNLISSWTNNGCFRKKKWQYDVFLSFAGEDTRLKFIDHLYDALVRRGVRCFRDEEGIQRGEVIKEKLLQAIKDSLCAVVVLSENYAKSTWCLDELKEILESPKKLGLRVFPVFYNVDPSNIRHQRGSLGEALAELERRFQNSQDDFQKLAVC